MKHKKGIVCSVAVVIAIVLQSGEVQVNRAGLELIGNAEACRLEPYICPAGVWTDGIGNTVNVIPGQHKSVEQIAADWTRNINVAVKCIRRHFNGDSMHPDTFAAFTSLAFRVGCYGIRMIKNPKSGQRQQSKLHYHAQRRNFAAACNEMIDFVSGDGKKLPGLVARAKKETALCLSGLRGEINKG